MWVGLSIVKIWLNINNIIQKIKYNWQLTEWKNEDSKEHDDDITPHIVAGVVEGDAAAILECLEATPANHRGCIR